MKKTLFAASVLIASGAFAFQSSSSQPPPPDEAELNQNRIAGDRDSLIVRMIPTEWGPYSSRMKSGTAYNPLPGAKLLQRNGNLYSIPSSNAYVGHIVVSDTEIAKCFGDFAQPKMQQLYKIQMRKNKSPAVTSAVSRSPCYEIVTRNGLHASFDRMVEDYELVRKDQIEELRDQVEALRFTVELLKKKGS